MKLLGKLLPILFILIGSVSFSQVNLPIQGKFKAPVGADFDYLEIKENRVNSYKGDQILGTFFAIENINNLYVLEVAKPGTISLNPNIQTERHLMKVRILSSTKKESNLSITWPNGRKQELTLTKE
jgi:hypothetical protein